MIHLIIHLPAHCYSLHYWIISGECPSARSHCGHCECGIIKPGAKEQQRGQNTKSKTYDKVFRTNIKNFWKIRNISNSIEQPKDVVNWKVGHFSIYFCGDVCIADCTFRSLRIAMVNQVGIRMIGDNLNYEWKTCKFKIMFCFNIVA